MHRFLLFFFCILYSCLASAQVITNFNLYNAETEEFIGVVSNGQNIDLRTIGADINIVAAITA